MPIYYALISFGPTVVVEFTEHSGNFQQITMSILQELDTSRDTMTSYSSSDMFFHVIVSNGFVFLCLADNSFGKHVPYAYLKEVRTRFFSSKTLSERAKNCNAYELNRDFAPVLAQQMKRYNSGEAVAEDPNSQVKTLQRDVEGVRDIVTENIGKILERGEKLEILLNKTDDLNNKSETFVRSTRSLRRKMWWQNKKMCVILTIVLLLITGAVTVGILFGLNVI